MRKVEPLPNRDREAGYGPDSGVARAFPGGRVAHPEGQNEEENEEKLRKNERKHRKIRKNSGNVLILPNREWEASYGPANKWHFCCKLQPKFLTFSSTWTQGVDPSSTFEGGWFGGASAPIAHTGGLGGMCPPQKLGNFLHFLELESCNLVNTLKHKFRAGDW